MRILVILLFVCFSSVSFAQGPGGQNQQGARSASTPQGNKVPEFKAVKIVGIHSYDISKVLKKLKIKESDSMALIVVAALTTYNEQLAQIGIKYKDLFEGLDVVVNMNIKTAIKYKNRETLMRSMSMAMEKLNPIILEVKQKEKELNETLKNVLTEARFDKWEKYQNDERDKRMPNSGGSNNENRQRPNGVRGNGRPKR